MATKPKPQAVTASNDIYALAASRVGEAWKHETGQEAALAGTFLETILGLFTSLLSGCGGTGQQVKATAANPNLRTRIWLRTQAAAALKQGRRDEDVNQVIRAVRRTAAISSPDEIEEFRATELAPQLNQE